MLKKIIAVVTACVVLTAGSAFAADFVKSAEKKTAPEVISVTDQDGNELDGAIIITPYSDKAKNGAAIEELLDAAKADLSSKSIDALGADAKKAIDAAGKSADALAVSDLFDVTLTDAYANFFDTEGAELNITFATDFSKDDFCLVLQNCTILNGDDWSATDFKVNDDGTITCRFTWLCPIAFISEVSAITPDPEGPSSPQTSDDANNFAMMASIAAVVLLAGASITMVVKKTNK